MIETSILQLLFYFGILFLCVKPLGWYMAQVYTGKTCGLNYLLRPIEKSIYYLACIHPQQEMSWKKYLSAMLLFNLFGLLLIYFIQRIQFYLPLNPQHFIGVPADLAFNTAASFITNTDWQAYGGENTMSYLTQMLALTVQNFLSAATGMSLLMALIRGIARQETNGLGNFWVDMTRSLLYILLPLSTLLAVFLVSQGVIQNFNPAQKIFPLQAHHSTVEQSLPMGPVASQIAIKQLGTNGGGYFNTNSAHPFENPTPLSNFLEMLAILLIPAAFCYTFGILVHDKRQGWAIFIAMFMLILPCIGIALLAEQKGNPLLTQMGICQTALHELSPGGNMEGKEMRFGAINSALWATITTATSNGSTNAMYDSFTPIGGLIPLWMMHLGEVAFGGVGSGLYGMLMLILLTVFITGLMVGRTPEYLGKKIEPFEIMMASVAILIMPLIALICTAIAAVTPLGIRALANPGAHGFTEMLYAFTSMSNNNGSAFAGLNANTLFYNVMGGIVMLIGRFWIAIPILALAGSLVRKKTIPLSSGTLPTHTPLFIILLVSVTIIISALAFIPALALGPIVEHLILWGQHDH